MLLIFTASIHGPWTETNAFHQPKHLRAPGTPDLNLLPFTKVALGRILRQRSKLQQYNSVEDALNLLKTSKNIMVLSGAGISTSCGIPDFRSATGLYATLQAEGKYDLDDPQQMFDISYFREHPEVFYSFAKQIYPSNFTPSPCHLWIKSLEDQGRLLRNYTQNIDTLEQLAGVKKVLNCHGSFSTASCLRCKRRQPGDSIESNIMRQEIPWCEPCREERALEIEAIKAYKSRMKRKGKNGSDSDDSIPEWSGEPGIIKPDIVFFGQALEDAFDEALYEDREKVDLLVIMGTSLKVAPVSEVLSHIPHSVPQIFINLTPVTHVNPDISLIGDADSIVTYLSARLGWPTPSNGKPVKIAPENGVWETGSREANKHIHVYRSASDTPFSEAQRLMIGTNPLDDIVPASLASPKPRKGKSRNGSRASSRAGSRAGSRRSSRRGSPVETRSMASRETSIESDERPPKRSRRGSMSHLHEEIKPDVDDAGAEADAEGDDGEDHAVQDVSIEIKERLEVTTGTATPTHPEDLPTVQVSAPTEEVNGVKKEEEGEEEEPKVEPIHPHAALPLAALLNPAPNP